MAPGAGHKPVNIFKLRNLGEPEGVFNPRLWWTVLAFGLLGAARGVDEGLIVGSFTSVDFRQLIDLDNYSLLEQTNIKGNISTMVILGSILGATLAFAVCDWVGRLWATRQLCVIWLAGVIIYMLNNGSLAAIYIGRFLAGLGLGQTVVIGPVYLAEVSPASVRGLCSSIFGGFVYIGIFTSFLMNYVCHVKIDSESRSRWMIPTSMHLIVAVIQLAVSFFLVESPRYLVKKGKIAEAAKSFAWLRRLPEDSAYIQNEVAQIQRSLDEEMEASRNSSFLSICKELVCRNTYRLYITCFIQILSQWSGAGALTMWSPELFKMIGRTSQSQSLLYSTGYGFCKLVAGWICTLFLVDVLGRKFALYAGIGIQAVSALTVASYLTAVPGLGTDPDFVFTSSGQRIGSIVAVVAIYMSGFGWAMGWNSVQYVLTAEIFPLRTRALASSGCMMLHFIMQYGCTRAMPNMLLPVRDGGINPSGTFWVFASITIIGGLWVWLQVPETAGRSLESMDRLFALPWYKIGLKGTKEADRMDAAAATDVEANGPEVVEALHRLDSAGSGGKDKATEIASVSSDPTDEL